MALPGIAGLPFSFMESLVRNLVRVWKGPSPGVEAQRICHVPVRERDSALYCRNENMFPYRNIR
jgi:hypothetical protein